MNTLSKIIIFTLIVIDIFLLFWILLHDRNIALLHPAGLIAEKQRTLFITAILLSLVIIIPVFIAMFFVAWKYRAGNAKAVYSPNWHNRKLEFLWWILPSIIIFILALITWKSTFDLDPYKPLENSTKPVTIQVVALQWKWLFIYPDQNIATVNYIAFPEKTPVAFELTADAPMNSFWIPNLGGQVYAMEGMITQLHLIAEKQGEFPGSSAEISGEGFAGMRFIAKATSQEDFDAWVKEVQQSPNTLDFSTYTSLAKPSEDTPRLIFSSVEKDLYNAIVMKYMLYPTKQENMHDMGNMDHMKH